MSLGDVAASLNLPVFPCASNKHPIVEQGFKAATRVREHVLAAFDRPGAALIGVPTGKASGIVVIDVDIKNGRQGAEWLDANRDALPQTRTHKTQSGGLHLVFRNPEVEIRNSQSRVAPGIDVRGEGGFVIYPPSAGYQIADSTEPADMPLWLIKACRPPERPPPPVYNRAPPRQDGGSAYGLAALASECEAISRAGFGQQEHTLNSGALKIGALVAGGELQESIAIAELLAAGRAMSSEGGREPWTPQDVERKVRRAFADGAGRPRKAPERPISPPRHDPPPSIEDDAYWRSVEAQAAGDTVPVHEPDPPPDGKPPLWIVQDPWNEDEIPVRPWIVRGYLMRGTVTVVSGPGSAGKSSLMVAWCSCLALGSSFGRMKITERFRVATYNVEDDESEQKRRFSAMAQRLQIDTGQFRGNLAIIGPTGVGTLLLPRSEGGPLLSTPAMQQLMRFVEEFRPDVLALDPFVELHSADENDNTAIRGVMAALRSMAITYNMAVVVLHHSRKGAGDPGDPDSLRGASSIVGAARVVLTINVMSSEESDKIGISEEMRRSYFRLDGAKSNYAPIEEAEWFERQERQLANGDAVAIAWPWKPPSPFRDLSSADLNSVLDEIASGHPSGGLFSPTSRGGASRWCGKVLVDRFGMPDGQAKSIIDRWLQSGLLAVEDFKDVRQGRERPGVRVKDSLRPS